MPRSPLKLLAVALLCGIAMPGGGAEPHLDPTLLPLGCVSCHRGHGVPRSPMLPAPQAEVCLACHDTQAKLDAEVRRGSVAPTARPTLLSEVLTQPFRHPLDERAVSRREPGVVTCTSCHSPHRGLPLTRPPAGKSGPRLSPRDPARFEYELCESCHGTLGATTQSVADLARLFDPSSRSAHPVHAPAMETSPSLRAGLSGREIGCGDCHGASDPGAPAGPHGSSVPFVLRAAYATTDGAIESESAYALCYGCHRRAEVLERSTFPEHARHVVDGRISCATCHNSHGAVENRSLIRFGEETVVGAVAPAMRSGRLEFISTGPGSGLCYVSCHGRDHDPASYGSLLLDTLGLQLPDAAHP